MDTDDGVEVVWNEVRYSNRKVARGSKVRIHVGRLPRIARLLGVHVQCTYAYVLE